MAPEIILKKLTDTTDGYNCMVDWWSLGILLHEMVIGSTPFNDAKSAWIINNIVQ